MTATGSTAVSRMCFPLVGTLLLLLTSSAGQAQAPEPEDGLFITVHNQITTASFRQIKDRINRAISQPDRRIKKVVFDFNPDDKDAATESHGSCQDFARYIRDELNFNSILTIAFVHGKTTRHTVLPVLACSELVMSTDAKLGEVATSRDNISDEDAREYAKFAGESREAVVLKMLDRNIEVVMGLRKGSPIYVDSAKAGKPGPFQDVFVPKDAKVVLPRGSIGLYNTEQAIRFGLSSAPLNTRQEVKDRYNLPPAAMDDFDDGKAIKACKIELVGAIDESMKQKFKRQLNEVRSRKENLLFIVVDCSGGNAKVAREIADELRELKNDDKSRVRTIAFIKTRAPDLATFIAFGCSEIVMSKEAVIGEFEQFLASGAKDPSNTLQFIQANLREIADLHGYSTLIVDGMLEKDATIYYVRNKQTGGHIMMSARQFAADEGKKNFVIVKTIKQAGSLLKLDAALSRELRVAQFIVDNPDLKEVYALYGVADKDVRDSQPGWLDDFAAFVRRTEVSILLVIIAFAGLILEFKMPGATIPGLVSLICFILFFWAHAYANGQMTYLAVALFVLGLILLGVEIFILPGFGVTGISGILLVLTGVVLATMEKAPSSMEDWTQFAARLLQYGLTLVAAGALSLMFARYLPKIPYANRLMLVPPTDKPDMDGEMAALPGVEQAAALLGQVGVATSMLRPAGMAKFGDQYVDVVTEGDFISPGTPIQVVEVESTRIVVKKV